MGLSGCLAQSPWIPNLEENRGRKNVCVVVRTAAAADPAPASGRAARNRNPVPTPLWASAGGGETSRFLGPRAFPLESLEWAGWCRSSKNSDRAQKAPDLPKSNLKPLCILLGWGSSEPPSRSCSLGTNATLRCALARGRTLSEAQCRVSAGTQPPHGYQAAAGAVGQGAGPGFLGRERKGRGFPASDAGPGDRPRKSLFPIFNAISFIST